MALLISGTLDLDAIPVQATLRLYLGSSGAFIEEVESAAIDGAYTFGDGVVELLASTEYFVLCHYGTDVRPLAHGPVVPVGEGGSGFELISLGLIGRWILDEQTGTTAADTSPSANNGTLTGMGVEDWIAAGPNGLPALDFDGINDYLNMGDVATFNDLADMTLCAHINTPDVTTFSTPISKYLPSNDRSFYLGISGGKLYGAYSPDGTSSTFWASDDALLLINTDTHIGFSVDMVSGTGALYVDGVEIASTKTGTTHGTLDNKLGRLIVGASDSAAGEANYFKGEIADPRIYSRVLTTAEFLKIASGLG